MVELSRKANKIAKSKYFVDENETWNDLCLRVAGHVASPEKEEEKDKYTAEFFQMLNDLYFLAGGRVLANSGTGITNLFNCFKIGIGDSRQEIFQALKDVSEIFAYGGGCGYNFSNLREEGAEIKSTRGKASGPLSFADMFNYTGEVIQQSSRRGAQLLILNCDHPDIEKFIYYKSKPNKYAKRILDFYKYNLKQNNKEDYETEILEKTLVDDQLTHFNVSVGITDKFMQAVKEDADWDLISPASKQVVKTVKAKELLLKMAKQAWKSGDPGLFFLDRFEKDNMTPYIGKIDGANPCSEIGLIDGEACCLGSLNLYKFYDQDAKAVDFVALEYYTRLAVRFLDNIHDISYLSVEHINKRTRGLRRLGLGMMGFADLLAEMEIPYDSEEGRELGSYLSWFINFIAWQESIKLGEERGTFPEYIKEKIDINVVRKVFESPYVPFKFDLENAPYRNVAVTAIAPTGTLGLIADVNSGIEPFFMLAYKRNITEGIANVVKDVVIEINPILLRKLKELKFTHEQIENIKNIMMETGSIQSISEIPSKIKSVFKTALEISPEDHLSMQAVWQEFISNAISKTVNLPEKSSVNDVYEIFIKMWETGIKSSTIYRQNSKSFQILNLITK